MVAPCEHAGRAAGQQHKNSLLHVHTVLCLIEDYGAHRINDRICHLLVAMGR